MNKKILTAALLCVIFCIASCGPDTKAICDKATQELKASEDVKAQAQKELEEAKKRNKVLGIPNIFDSKEVKEAKAKLANAELLYKENLKKTAEVCK
ncbi:MAG: hypothetical protein KBI07_07110 [Candidatus Atribacteria bacterium]|nr:hypothetical protein [Candidatus Atribacteria bacterium]